MKVKVDSVNGVVIATGNLYGKRIKAISRCSKEDTFNEDFGVKLAKQRFKIKKTKAKIASTYEYIRILAIELNDARQRINCLEDTLERQENEADDIIAYYE